MRLSHFFALCTLAFICSCTNNQKSHTKNNTMCVSIAPIRSIVKSITGDDFKIKIIVPQGASPENYEPTPKQYIDINECLLLFNTGLIDFEQSMLSKVEDNSHMINLSKGIELISGSCTHTHGSHHHHGVDPHIWTSPSELKTMSTNCYAAIHKLYPDSIKYTKNFDLLIEKITDLDQKIAKQIEASGVSQFLIYHPAMTYYARAYGIEQISIENHGKEPSARRVSEIISNARENGASKVLYQKEYPRSSVEVIASDIKAEPVEIDPLREDVIDNIQDITNIITSR